MPDLVQDLLQQFTTAWWDSDTHRPALPATFTAQEQAAREAHLDRFTNTISAEMRAQCRSLELLHRTASPYEVDVLGISLEKGGTSVLADGYLVAGSLTRPQAELAFGFGAYLQIVDDSTAKSPFLTAEAAECAEFIRESPRSLRALR